MKLLDFSSSGAYAGLIKALKVLGYHVFSVAVVAAFGALAEGTGHLSVAHPQYALYLTAAVAFVNALAAFVTKWLGTINPDTAASFSSSTVSPELSN